MKKALIKTLFKTVIITLIASLSAFSIFDGFNLHIETALGFVIIGCLFFAVVGLIAGYCYYFNTDIAIISFMIMIFLSMLIVFLIGIALGNTSLNDMILAWFIALPSVLFLDRLFEFRASN